MQLRLAMLFALILVAPRSASAQQIEFGRDVLPILSDACFHCHGTDPNTREADLRLDTEEGLFTVVERNSDLEDSELFHRVFATDLDEAMPPRESHRQLSAAEKATIRRWLQAGAPWAGHWAFEPIQRPEIPPATGAVVSRPIDAFVRNQLASTGLQPAPPAARGTLLRRVALDLTGLPPSPAIARAFLDASEDELEQAYGLLIDQLLDTPAFGERMASVWMEVGRYADSDGYQLDQVRTQYPWRDWVIRAFNDNLPFDEFLVEQLAGDLLPNATESQIIATGFNRNHILNGEGGVDPDETRIEVVADRTETTATVFLGLTMSCCRCHDHKYDPLTQEDYFRFFAFFNNVDEDGKAGHRAKPFLTITTSKTEREQAEDFQSHAKHHHIEFPQQDDQIRVAVMRDRQTDPRKTYILNRGNWNEPTREVTAAPPAFLPAAEDLPPNRLGLASWMIDDRNPLTARVAVNRFWELFFGQGLVKTQEDFGVQGDRPTYPELLDWLAADFRDHGWDVKRLLKQIVTSATYRQSSAASLEQLQTDPANEWLGRGSRFRHPSWMLRDQALAVSGLLNTKMYGPPGRPYQPKNIWYTPTAEKLRYVHHTDQRLYRKSLYTFWRRNIGPANMFDASTRRVCQVKARRTNTPLHALTTLNDVTYVETARVLAQSVMQDSHEIPAVDVIFARVTLREPTDRERSELVSLQEACELHYRNDPAAAEALLSVGEHPSTDLDQAKHASLTNVALLVLNLDETLSHF